MKNTAATDASDHPSVSVILPTFNRSRLLTQVLKTVSHQEYPGSRYEIIVVDNNSADDTEAVVRRFAETCAVDLTFVREPRQGLVFTRHTGAALARGEILVFGDDDALYEPNWLAAIIDVYRRYPQVGAVGTAIRVKWDEEPEPWVRRYEGYLGQIGYPSTPVARVGLDMNGGSCSIRKRLLYAVRGFNPGQKGDYILGDSEVGLCRKIAALGVSIGGTSATTAWHLQFRQTHGTYDDLKRRFRNNGICQAYADTYYGNGVLTVAGNITRQAATIARTFAGRVLRGRTDTLWTDAALQLNELGQRLKYLLLYRSNSQIRQEISKRDWELSSDYETPAPVYARIGRMSADSEAEPFVAAEPLAIHHL
jgi:glycosyltransferase involved in cell wall biosynthesis